MQRTAAAWTLVLSLGCGRIGYEGQSDAPTQPGGFDAGAIDEVDASTATPDAASTDASTDGGAPQIDECAAAYADALVCSGFESATSDAWMTTTRDGAVAPQTARARTGGSALHASTSGMEGFAILFRTFPMQGEIWGRLYLYLPSSISIDAFNYMGLDRQGSGVSGLDFRVNADGTYAVYSNDFGLLAGPTRPSVPRDRWMCVQWYARVSDADGAVKLIVDGEEQFNASGIDTSPGGTINRINVGVDWSRAALDLFIDDLVLDTQPVPCE